MQKLAVLCDFDGTITTTDISDYVLKEFTDGDWEKYDIMYNDGILTYKEYINILENQFYRLNDDLDQVISSAVTATGIRQNFEKLVDYCDSRYPLTIVSFGLDFIINAILRQNGWIDMVKTFTTRTRFNGQGFGFEYPELRYPNSQNIKDDTVTYYKQNGAFVVYIGDGIPDYYAAERADLRFSVKGSALSKLFEKKGVAIHEFTDFNEVLDVLKYELS